MIDEIEGDEMNGSFSTQDIGGKRTQNVRWLSKKALRIGSSDEPRQLSFRFHEIWDFFIV
jgi:hypothetical protein